MKQTIVIRDAILAERAAEHINFLVDGEELHEVVIRPHSDNRSLAQKGLYFLWVGVIANELGETKEAIHERYKEKYLVPIYERDDAEYAAMIQAVRTVHTSGMKKEAEAMRRKIVKLTSTNDANVKQFTEYLTDVERHAASLHISLPHPDDYHRAMGRAA